MSIILRIALVVGAILITAFSVVGVRKSHMRIEDSVFWLGLSAVILLLSIFPEIGYAISNAFGFLAPVNFIFALFLFILTVKLLSMSRRASELETKVRELTQQVALAQFEKEQAQRAANDAGAPEGETRKAPESKDAETS